MCPYGLTSLLATNRTPLCRIALITDTLPAVHFVPTSSVQVTDTLPAVHFVPTSSVQVTDN
jgi:hypothetical protein